MKKLFVLTLIMTILGGPSLVSIVSAATPPQTDRAERRAYEERLENNLQEMKSIRVELDEAKQKRLETQHREQVIIKDNRQDRIEELRKIEKEKEDREQLYIAKQRELLLKIIDTMIDHRARMKTQAEMYLSLNSAGVQALITDLNTDLTELQSIKAQVPNATIENVRALANTLKNFRRDTTMEKLNTFVLLTHITKFEQQGIQKAKERATVMREALNRLNAQGKDVSTALTLLGDAGLRLQTAENDLSSLRSRLTNSGTISSADLAKSRIDLNDIKNQLRTVYDVYLEIAQHVKVLF